MWKSVHRSRCAAWKRKKAMPKRARRGRTGGGHKRVYKLTELWEAEHYDLQITTRRKQKSNRLLVVLRDHSMKGGTSRHFEIISKKRDETRERQRWLLGKRAPPALKDLTRVLGVRLRVIIGKRGSKSWGEEDGLSVQEKGAQSVLRNSRRRRKGNLGRSGGKVPTAGRRETKIIG